MKRTFLTASLLAATAALAISSTTFAGPAPATPTVQTVNVVTQGNDLVFQGFASAPTNAGFLITVNGVTAKTETGSANGVYFTRLSGFECVAGPTVVRYQAYQLVNGREVRGNREQDTVTCPAADRQLELVSAKLAEREAINRQMRGMPGS